MHGRLCYLLCVVCSFTPKIKMKKTGLSKVWCSKLRPFVWRTRTLFFRATCGSNCAKRLLRDGNGERGEGDHWPRGSLLRADTGLIPLFCARRQVSLRGSLLSRCPPGGPGATENNGCSGDGEQLTHVVPVNKSPVLW